ncbi:MAG: phosphotransferase family protein [Gammaproteobacteria bacterium]|nr:phosphotransferase family protein [Gammaproteobacteria bacterium]
MKNDLDGINADSLKRWFAEYIDGVDLPLQISLISGGHSNLTFSVLDNSGRSFVLRRPPLGKLLESAHDVAREHRIISALAGSNVPVPSALGICNDVDINGAPFYVMDHVEGAVLHNAKSASPISMEHRKAIGLDVIDVLARLHDIDPDAVGLGNLSRKEAYLERQLKRWIRQLEASTAPRIPGMDEVSNLLRDRMPQQVGASIVHGDYRLGNLIVNDGKIHAVLDWELCTLGDALADVGYLLNCWTEPDEQEPLDESPTAAGGFPGRDELAARYASVSGRDLSDINYYRAFSHWRLAAIGQGVYERYQTGSMGKEHSFDLGAHREKIVRRTQEALKLLA